LTNVVPVITTLLPTIPVAGVKLAIAGSTLKLVGLSPVPAGVVTAIKPVVAVAGTVAVIWVAELTVKLAPTPLKVTAVAPVNAVPVIVTTVPTTPLAGKKPVTLGSTVNGLALTAVPAAVVTATGPELVSGTVAVIWVEEFTVYDDTATPLILTAETPLNPVPVTTIPEPTTPDAGATLVIAGSTVKTTFEVALPAGVVTETFPLVAPGGTVAEICEPEETENEALTPLNDTAFAPTNPLPPMTAVEPITPELGDNDVMPGSTVKLPAEPTVPPRAVTVIGPEVAFAGTLAAILVVDFTVNFDVTPLNFTALTPVKPDPEIVTVAPTAADFGENDVIFAVTAQAGDVKPATSAALRRRPPTARQIAFMLNGLQEVFTQCRRSDQESRDVTTACHAHPQLRRKPSATRCIGPQPVPT
jgi:hypothetical protein